MSISRGMTLDTDRKFIIPCAGKMFRSSVAKDDKALCFVINKGYFETSTLEDMLEIKADMEDFKEVVLVGGTDKVLTKCGVVYRQRLFIKSLNKLCNIFKMSGVRVEISDSFQININNVMNVLQDLPYLERYARKCGESIDDWLTHCCILELCLYLHSKGIESNKDGWVDSFLRGKVNYLYRAPFLIASYSIDRHSSSIYLGYSTTDRRLYDVDVTGEELLKYGYTGKNLEMDIRLGALNDENKVSRRNNRSRRGA